MVSFPRGSDWVVSALRRGVFVQFGSEGLGSNEGKSVEGFEGGRDDTEETRSSVSSFGGKDAWRVGGVEGGRREREGSMMFRGSEERGVGGVEG